MKHILALIVAVLLSPSCYTIVHDYKGSREITPGTKLTKSSTKVGDVVGEKKAKFLFWGLVDLNEASGVDVAESAAVAKHGENFDGLTHVRIHEEQTAVDVIVEFLTLGIFVMLTVEAEAEVHQFEGGGA